MVCEKSCRTWNTELFPHADSYSSAEIRKQWLVALSSRSATSIQYAFGPAGQLMGLSGSFPIASNSKRDLQKWILGLRVELGLPAAASLSFQDSKPFYESTWEEDGVAGLVATFEVLLEGFVVGPREISVVVSADGKKIRGLYNSFRPLGATSFARQIDEVGAWAIASNITPAGISTKLSARLVLADSSELLSGIPGMSTLHWELKCDDSLGYPRTFLIDASSGGITYQSPERFNFDVPRYHYKDAWVENQPGTPPNPPTTANGLLYSSAGGACSLSSPFCVGAPLDESHLQPATSSTFGRRQNLATLVPRVLDLWYVQSVNPGPVVVPPVLPNGFRCTPTSGCFQVPFSSPLNQLVDLKVSVMHAFPKRDARQSAVASIGADGWLYVTATKNTGDIIGHEYGHRIEALRGFMIAGRPDLASPAWAWAASDYNEAMMDVFGHSTEKFLDGANNWKLNEGELNWCQIKEEQPYELCASGGTLFTRSSDLLTIQWDTEIGDCTSVGQLRRKAIGRILYAPWLELETQFGASAVGANYDFFFRAWMSEVLRTHYLATPNFTKLIDFYAAAVARGSLTAPNGIGPRIQERMVWALEGAFFSDWLPGAGTAPSGRLGLKCLR